MSSLGIIQHLFHVRLEEDLNLQVLGVGGTIHAVHWQQRQWQRRWFVGDRSREMAVARSLRILGE